MKKILLIFLFYNIISFSQSIDVDSLRHYKISGYVLDSNSKEPLSGATIQISGINIGTITNTNGYFELLDIPEDVSTLKISYLGYNHKEFDITSGKYNTLQLNALLEKDLIEIEQIVIVDYRKNIDKLANKPISTIVLNGNQINTIPKVIEADLLRALQSLPGIQSISDFSSSIYVRGGTPGQNAYLIDGTDIYNPEHAFGIFSTFNTSAIEKVELSKGGFSSEYGGRLSSVLNVTNLDGYNKDFKVDLGISLLAANVTFQSPLSSIASLSGSIRRTYIDQTYAKMIDRFPDYYFYDGSFKAHFSFDANNKLILSFYGGHDDLDYVLNKKSGGDNSFLYNWGNLTGSINYQRVFFNGLSSSFLLSMSNFDSDFDFEAANIIEKSKIRDVSFKSNLEYYLSNDFDFKIGFEWKNISGFIYEKFQGGLIDANKNRQYFSGYISSNIKPFDNLTFQAGLRYDLFKSDVDYQNLDPRLTIKYRLSESDNLKLSYGVYHQYLNRIPRLFLTSIWTSADKYYKGSGSTHYIASYQKDISNYFELELELYFKNYDNIYTYNQNYLTEIIPDYYDEKGFPVITETRGLFNKGKGSSIGAEVLLRKDYGSITGWVGYSYSKSKVVFENINNEKYFMPRHDRTHTINLVTNLNINDILDEIYDEITVTNSKWLLSFNFVYSSGQPITLPGSIYLAYTMPDWNNHSRNIATYPSETNAARLPDYIRLDFSITWEKNFGSWIFAPYFQVFNVGNRSNVWFVSYENMIENGVVKQVISNQNMFPILPSLGVNIKF